MKWLIPVISFVAGAVLMMVLMNKCNGDTVADLQKELQASRDSVKLIVDSNNVLTKQRSELAFEKIMTDSVNSKKIDSLSGIISVLKKRYYADTMRFVKAIQRLQEAFNKRDSLKAQAAIDSLIIEARSANWSATNLFFQYDERDSVWRFQKAFDDSVYHVLYMIDSAKDGRFNALLRINTQLGDDYEKALKELASVRKRGKFWFAIGAILGAATNLIHK